MNDNLSLFRCKACNKRLTTQESKVRNPITEEFEDLCTDCLDEVPVDPLEVEWLQAQIDDELDEEGWDLDL